MTTKNEKYVPKILLVGAGYFGKNHLRLLRKLEQEGRLTLLGVVVKTEKNKKRIAKDHNIPVFTNIPLKLLKKADAVDIVTPIDTHFSLVKKCLRYTNVLSEKPLSSNYEEARLLELLAKKNKRVLMVAHTYRFHPVVQKLKSLFDNKHLVPNLINGQFINPAATDSGENPSLDLLHFFDIIDFLFKRMPSIIDCRAQDRVHNVSLRYPENIDVFFQLGWRGAQKIRLLDFFFKKDSIHCNLLTNTIETVKNNKIKKIICSSKIEPLEKELRLFINLLQKTHTPKDYPDAAVGARILKIALKAQPLIPKTRPRVAIIGAGIFGTNSALELSKSCNVTIFERNSDIMNEASFVNQYRHHWGYHYPRSPETVDDIKNATKGFEALYEQAIIRDFPTYYGIAKQGSKVSASAYINFCQKHDLPFILEYPDSKYLDKDKIAVCLKTFEPIYDYTHLKSLVKFFLSQKSNVKIKFNSNILDGKLLTDGKKELTVESNNNIYKERFDYVINSTYANHNVFAEWFDFPKKQIRIDLVEALIVRLPIPRISLAVMDGPFTNLVPTGEENIFTLVHIKESILKRFVPANGLVPQGLQVNSNAKIIIEKSKEWFPILKKAEYLESRFVFRCVNAYREHDDARPSDITRHGFGCYSILGGKILNSVNVAQKISEEINSFNYKNTNSL